MNTRKYIVVSLLLFCFAGKVHSQDLPKELYIAAGIPDSLKEDANSVVRYSSDEITVDGPGKEVVKHHSIITVLNEKGDDEANLILHYNRKYDTYTDIVMRIYDASGLLIKKYHKSDMYDVAEFESEMLIGDDRKLEIGHTVANYPATVEIEYEEDLTSFINLNDWDIQDDQQSIQNEILKIVAKPNIGFRYKCENTNITPIKTTQGDLETYTWKVSNLKAWKIEDGAMYWNVLPGIKFAVDKFEYEGYPGDLSTWQNYGKWQQVLNSDVVNLSPQRISEIQELTAGFKTDKEKAKFLYEYMQQNTRYVFIALGIGGFKPFTADFVDKKKYGDCKALSNYMVSMLRAINIPAYYATVRSGSNEEACDPTFPYDMSNHIIVCVPFKGDTTWLECTNNINSFGQLGAFTENRNALLITEDGGKLVNTPKSKAEENQFNSEVHIVLDSTGGAKAQIKILSTGEYRGIYIDITRAKEDRQKEYLLNSLNIKQPSVFNFNSPNDKDGIKETDIDLEYDKFCDLAAGDKLFYHPRVLDISNVTVPVVEKRKSDYYFEFPRINTCTTTIDLPAGYVVETLPVNQSLKFTYGNYEISYTYDAVKNQVISKAKFNLNNHVIPAAKYTEMQQYLDAVAKAQNKKLVIRHKA